MSTTIATLVADRDLDQRLCQACGHRTDHLVQVSLGDVWIGSLPLCEECYELALDPVEAGPDSPAVIPPDGDGQGQVLPGG